MLFTLPKKLGLALAASLITSAGLAAPPEPAKPPLSEWAERLQRQIASRTETPQYGLRTGDLTDGTAETGAPVVVYIHGFNSSVDAITPLVEPVKQAGYCCIGFGYSNNQRVTDSAQQLSKELKRFAQDRPGKRVTLVTHSMGGLVARACIEATELDPGNVDRLIMVAPPTHGSELARLATSDDLWMRWAGGNSLRTRDLLVDNLGKAAVDLVPDSPFLIKLNGRPRNPLVRYSLVIGDAGAVSQQQLSWLRQAYAAAKLAGGGERVDHLAARLEEIVEGRGDGVVSVARAKLDGVDDSIVLPFNHLEVTRAGSTPAAEAARAEVLKRVRGAPATPPAATPTPPAAARPAPVRGSSES